MLRIGYYQFRPQFGQIQENLKQVLNALKDVSADLIVLPELAFTGYYFKDREETRTLAEDPQDSSTIESLVALCRDKDFYLITGFAEKQQDKVFNSSLLIGPEGVIHTYRKLHLFSEEKNWFDPGDIPLQVWEVREANVGMMVCFDWIFPEVTRTLTVEGADIICHPSNLVLDYCQQTMLSRCLENGVFAVTANRYGADKRPHGELRFTGKSQIVAPKGELLHRSKSQKQEVFITEIDPILARDKHITPLNQIISDRRPEFYAPLSQV
ncbi:acyltransferase [candidate division KSB1 bacterium]|nr:acyltransferase [candidate division KSB1 bacterium]NIR71428.1 acyltransferase [candidate division KSB1 bacterium]NIS23349.1 acyltransferase [candidate division KSB1 bacterium]NIT70240.1 acyltransferase [candidate division KSB1 bacterium]NIU23963.1 acyltransferase [candidate division KSB1 bacterium]